MITNLYPLYWISIVSVLYAAVFLLMLSYLRKRGLQGQQTFSMLLSKSILFLIITIPFIFSRHWITIFWGAQAIALLWVAGRLKSRNLAILSYLLFTVVIIKFLFYDYTNVFLFTNGSHIQGSYAYLQAERYVTTALVLVMSYVATFMTKKHSLTFLMPKNAKFRGDSTAFFTTFTILLFIVLNIEVSAFFHDYFSNARFAAISALWTLYAAGLMATGFKSDNSRIRFASLILFLVTLAKVVLLDMARLSTPYRIFSFIILGLVMLGASYIYYKHKNKLRSVFTLEAEEVETA